MTSLVVPDTIDKTGATPVWPQLAAFLATAVPGDTVQFPANAHYWCDYSLSLATNGVKYFCEGASFEQHTARPYGASRTDVTITADGLHFTTGTALPRTCNYGYINGTGINPGTEITLDSGLKSGTLNGKPATPATGLSVIFTSKQDRGRCGFNISATDWEVHDASWKGVDLNDAYVSTLEGQACVLFSGAGAGLLSNVWAHDVFGDWLYFGARGTKLTTDVEVVGGGCTAVGRSGIVTPNAQDCSVTRATIGGVARTIWDLEPPYAACIMNRFSLTDSIIGAHRLNLVSSGGDVNAHVGALEFSRNTMMATQMVLNLTAGAPTHYRGPYTIADNVTKNTQGFGTPLGGLVLVSHALGATVTGNTGIVLQTGRTPQMAVVRYKSCSGPVVVHSNGFVGGIEVGPMS